MVKNKHQLPNLMNLPDWCLQAEELRVMLAEEYWKMRLGLPYSEERIKNLESQNGAHHQDFLNTFTEPRLIVLDALESVATSKTVKTALAFEDKRKTHIISKEHQFLGAPVNWPSWRQWASQANERDRKQVFDTFISQTPSISPLIQKRFETSLAVFKAHEMNPLDAFLEHHHLSVGQLRAIIEQLRDATKTPFMKAFSRWTHQLFSREPAYYDDYYFMRNKIYEDLAPAFSHVDSLTSCIKTLRAIGLDPTSIKVDDSDRPGKYPSPFCQFLRIPTDIRVSYRKENPLNTTVAVYHEYGHAIHASNVDSKLPYWTRNLMSMGLCESFSTFFEELISDDAYCTSELGLSLGVARELRARMHFHNLFAVSFYCANSLFRIDTYEKEIPFEEWDDLYSTHIKDCMGIDIPGAYWKLHHILPESLVYVPAYLLAFIRSHEMQATIQKDCGPRWWRSPSAGTSLQKWMKPGQDSKLSDFSRLDVRTFLKYLKEEP